MTTDLLIVAISALVAAIFYSLIWISWKVRR